MKISRTRVGATQIGDSGDEQLASIIEKFDSENASLIRSMRKTLRKRMPTANELVYDNYNFFVIGIVRQNDRQIASFLLLRPRTESGFRSITEPPCLIRSVCSLAAAAKTVL